MENKSFKLSDYSTSLYFYNDIRNDNSHYEILDVLLNTLKEHGFNTGLDQDVLKNYKSIAKDHFEGVRNKLAFKSHRYPTGFEIKFFYDTERGQYDFDTLEKMPYITKLEFLKYIKILKNKLIELGFEDKTKIENKSAEEKIKEDYVNCCHHENIKDMNFKLSDLDGKTDKYSYNHTDRDKKVIHNGETKYFRSRRGYLQRGKVYHNINNMWWVILNDTNYTNIADFEMFDLNDKDKEQLRKIKKKKLYMNPKRREYHNQEYRIGDNLFIISCRTGLFKAITEYGYYEYHWSSSDHHKENILSFNQGYILNKFQNTEEIDFDATMKDWKETIIEWRRDNDLTEEQARNLWTCIEELDNNMSEEYTCRTFYDACEDEDIEFPYESFSITKKYTDNVISFWNLFEQFRDILREELGIKEDK